MHLTQVVADRQKRIWNGHPFYAQVNTWFDKVQKKFFLSAKQFLAGAGNGTFTAVVGYLSG